MFVFLRVWPGIFAVSLFLSSLSSLGRHVNHSFVRVVGVYS